MTEITPWFLHVDLDAFFASVEQLDHPEYRGKPVIVGGKPEDRRSVVSTASYEARKYGVHSAMPTAQAYKLCPQGIYVHGRMERYAEISYKIMNIFRDFSPDVQQMSIDEAFIDLTGTEKLFGPPEQTAMRIKEAVKNATGLTVSIGLATTKYLAKIASGYNKPDGFCYIHQGDEEKFMLSLPLNKVWGLGSKSQELIKNKGIKTTRDIYEKDIDTLEFLFGKNMGCFLYNVVRGKENASFNREAKSHSISSETTFPYDLTDLYTIETELLQLSHSVFFRLLKENAYSRTAFVKIRYGDFTTCSIQETLNDNILTLDSYFKVIKRLFEKKYDNSRGIRLLGVGLDNIEDTERPRQLELFENPETKKQTVERAILNLEKKHPEIKIKKARNISNDGKFSKTIKCLIAALLLLSHPHKLTSQEKDNSVQLFDYSISGHWKAEYSNSLLFTFGNKNTGTFSMDAGVFKQDVELSTLITLNNHWWFMADFADEFKRNTFAIEYKDSNFLRSARLSNRGITMPSGYSSDFLGFGLKGGNNQAPGINFHFQTQDDKFEADMFVRYDMTSSKTAVFYGKNQVTDTNIKPENFAYGYSFRFPEDSEQFLSDIDEIYVETQGGKYTDSKNRHYKKLSKSDYLYNIYTKSIYLSKNAGAGKQKNLVPSVIITFKDSNAVTSIIQKTGSYQDKNSFAGRIQNLFTEFSRNTINLSEYTPEIDVTIDNKSGLLIQSSSGFSPYLNANIYEYNNVSAEIFIFDNDTISSSSKYNIDILDSPADIQNDYFSDTINRFAVSNNNLDVTNYPFIETSPEIYLNLPSENGPVITLRNYSPVNEYHIGTNVEAGSVTVYLNNSIVYDAIYNANTGVVTLPVTPQNTDKIMILWQEDTSDFSNGNLATGIGAKYHFTENLLGDISVTAKWPVYFNQRFSTSDDIQNGFAALSTGIEYKNENLTISDKTAIALHMDNATDGLIIYQPKSSDPVTHYLDSDDGYLNDCQPVLNHNGKKIILEKDKRAPQNDFYAVTDKIIKGYAFPLSWNFDDDHDWAAVDIALSAGEDLHNASYLNFALKPENITNDDIDLFLQLGINAPKENYGVDEEQISTWKLDDIDFNSNQWQTLSVKITDSDRIKLSAYTDARLIVIRRHDTIPDSNGKGTIYFGPYEPITKGLSPLPNKDFYFNSYTEKEHDSSYTSIIKWNAASITESTDIPDTTIRVKTYFKETDFSNYQNIIFNFGLKGSNPLKYEIPDTLVKPGLTLKLLSSSNECSALLELKDITSLLEIPSRLHSFNINISECKLFIDGIEIDKSSYNLFIQKDIIPCQMELSINTVQNSCFYSSGELYINTLLIKNTNPYATLQNLLTFNYNLKGPIISIKDYDLLKDFNFTATSQQTSGNLSNLKVNFLSTLSGAITLADIEFKADTQLYNENLTNAGHSISSKQSFLNLYSFSESYRYNAAEKVYQKNNDFGLNFQEINIPAKLNYNVQAQKNTNYTNQSANQKMQLELPASDYTIKWNINFNENQKITTTPKSVSNYFQTWNDISCLEFSPGETDAFIRNESYGTTLSLVCPFFDFSPSIDYAISGAYNSSKLEDVQLKDITSIKFTLPFTFDNHSISFSNSRKGGDKTILIPGGTYFTDTNKIFELQRQRHWIYSSILFYELFPKVTPDIITGFYSTEYQLNYKRKLFNNYNDIFIPSSATFTVQRDLKKDLKSSDLYQYKLNITNTSINNFGLYSQKQFMKWFNQEEIMTGFTGLLKIPVDKPENLVYQLSTYMNLLIFIMDDSTVSTNIDYMIDSQTNWKTQLALNYARKSSKSLLPDLINIILSSPINFEITKRDSFTGELSRNTNLVSQNYHYTHEEEYKFKKYFTVSNSLGFLFKNTEKKSSNLAFEFSLGLKAEF